MSHTILVRGGSARAWHCRSCLSRFARHHRIVHPASRSNDCAVARTLHRRNASNLTQCPSRKSLAAPERGMCAQQSFLLPGHTQRKYMQAELNQARGEATCARTDLRSSGCCAHLISRRQDEAHRLGPSTPASHGPVQAGGLEQAGGRNCLRGVLHEHLPRPALCSVPAWRKWR